MTAFTFGPAWAAATRCCGKPEGCTNMGGGCLLRNHPWKRAHAGPPEPDDEDSRD